MSQSRCLCSLTFSSYHSLFLKAIPPVPARLLSKRNHIPRINVFINRNLQRPREHVMVDERRTPTWNLFLDHLTSTVSARERAHNHQSPELFRIVPERPRRC